MELTIDVVDAFTSKQFGGNAAAVVLVENWLKDDTMLAIAAQNNLSETAFVLPLAENRFHIRWFSPITEIDFCGHATLASAFVLFNRYPALSNLTIYADAVGEMVIRQTPEQMIVMDFPSRPPEPVEVMPQPLLKGLSIAPKYVLKNQQAYFAVYEQADEVRDLVTDSAKLAELGPLDVVVTAADQKYDFISRYFWPANGGDEDPVTGSIHTGLVPYWASRLNKSELKGFQASARGGELECQLLGDRVILAGQAVHYSTGTLFLQE